MTTIPELPLAPEQERELATRILALEREIHDGIVRRPEGRELLAGRRAGRTRAAAVHKLHAALLTLELSARVDDLQRRWREAERLRWRLALSATRIVYREAHRLSSNPTVSQPDLVQEGLIGLLDAAERFDPGHDNRFATYARWWVRAHMTRAIDLSRLVHLSAGAAEQLRNLRKQIRVHELAGASWTPAELARQLGLDPERTRTLLDLGAAHVSEESSADGQQVATAQLPDESGPAPDETVARLEDVHRVRVALETALPERQRFILEHRYGIDHEPCTLAEIASTLCLSRERVRQLERASLQALREACRR